MAIIANMTVKTGESIPLRFSQLLDYLIVELTHFRDVHAILGFDEIFVEGVLKFCSKEEKEPS